MAKKVNKQISPLELEGGTLIFKNFSGKTGPYNERGDRTFSVLIDDPQVAENLADLGWKMRELTQDDEIVGWHLAVKVNMDSYNPPRIYLVKNKIKELMNQETVGSLDFLKIVTADLVVNPYFWELRGDSGISAYLSALYVEVETNRFDDKYADPE